jgi:hypothetical protein
LGALGRIYRKRRRDATHGSEFSVLGFGLEESHSKPKTQNPKPR